MIEIRCPHCDHQLKVATEFIGRVGACNHCQGRFRVPTPPSKSRDDLILQLQDEAARLAAENPFSPSVPEDTPVITDDMNISLAFEDGEPDVLPSDENFSLPAGDVWEDEDPLAPAAPTSPDAADPTPADIWQSASAPQVPPPAPPGNQEEL